MGEQVSRIKQECQNSYVVGVVYVVDVSDLINMFPAIEHLHALLESSEVEDTPVLVLLNKCDKLREEFLDSMDPEEYLHLKDFIVKEAAYGKEKRVRAVKCSLFSGWGY